jgi:hypothetical protein
MSQLKIFDKTSSIPQKSKGNVLNKVLIFPIKTFTQILLRMAYLRNLGETRDLRQRIFEHSTFVMLWGKAKDRYALS